MRAWGIQNAVIYGALLLAIGAGGGFLLGRDPSTVDPLHPDFSYRTRGESTNALTNPLLECSELPESVSIGERIALEKRVEDYIAREKKKGVISNAAVYFRDLNNGPWFGVNEDKKFSPASLLKVPLAMAYFRKMESDPNALVKEIQFGGGTGDTEMGQIYGPTHRLEKEKHYTVAELVSLMIIDSSNEAASILGELLGYDEVVKIYTEFGQEVPQNGKDMQTDVRTYASFFRILYNATYLDRGKSEELLALLTQAKFKDGLVAGVPAGVRVAHKFGTRNYTGGAPNENQLHDCGIVYAPGNPYLLCVMTQGREYPQLANFIKYISMEVYDEVVKK